MGMCKLRWWHHIVAYTQSRNFINSALYKVFLKNQILMILNIVSEREAQTQRKRFVLQNIHIYVVKAFMCLRHKFTNHKNDLKLNVLLSGQQSV